MAESGRRGDHFTSCVRHNGGVLSGARTPEPTRQDMRQYNIPMAALQLDLADRKVVRIADVRDCIQKKTFTKWINKHLNKRSIRVNDLYEDFRDGHKLLTLLELLSSSILPREKGFLRFHCLENIKRCLEYLSKQKVRLVNIHAEDIVDGNPKLTLGLVWIIILKFQVADVGLAGQQEQSVRQSLLSWAQKTLSGYPITVTDFTNCWRDGKAFLYIIHRNRPDLVNMRQVASNTAQENLELAFSTAENHLGVTRLLDPEDMQVDRPDERSVITYISSLYHVFPLPSPSKPVQDTDLSTKSSEYEDLAKPLLRWIQQSISQCTTKEFPATLVEVKGVSNEFNRFRIEDIPAKLATKRRLEILFHELESMIGQFPLEEQIHIDNIKQAWDRFLSCADDRQAALEDEISRLQRLQKLAEKVHSDTKLCDGYLDDVEQRLSEELSRYDNIHPLDAKNNCDALQQILNKIESHVQSQLTDVQNLRDGRYHQSDNLYKRVFSVHQRLEGLRNRLQSELLPKIRHSDFRQSASTSFTTSNGAVGVATVPQSYSLNSISTSSSASNARSPVNRAAQQPFKSSSSVSDVMSASPKGVSPGRQGGVSGTVLLRQCVEWVEARRKMLDLSSLEFSSVAKLESALSTIRSQHSQALEFRSQLDACKAAKNDIAPDEKETFGHWLDKVESAYNTILGISSQQLHQCEDLLSFVKDSSTELKWLNDKEEEELTRNWNATTMTVDVMREHFQRLIDDLQAHEQTFSSIQDRGEAIVRQNAIGSSMCRSYLNAMQNKWGWLLKISSCIEKQLSNAQAYNQFMEDASECGSWLAEQTRVLNSEFSRANIEIEEGEVLIKRMQEMRNTLAHYEQVIQTLHERLGEVAPLRMRGQIQKLPVPATMICSYSHDEFALDRNEECILLDNSDPYRWRVRNSQAAAGLVPSICVIFPPPDTDCKERLAKLDSDFQRFIQLWKEKQSKLKQDMLVATMQVVKHWDFQKFKGLGVTQREAILKAVNSDAQKLLGGESSLSESKQSKLRETLQKCNDHFIKLNRKLRDKESKSSKSNEDRVTESLTNLTYTVNTLQSSLAIAVKEPVPRDVQAAINLSSRHKEQVEANLAQASDDLNELNKLVAGLSPAYHSKLAPVAAKLSSLHSVSSLHTKRIDSTQSVLSMYNDCSYMMSLVEKKLNSMETVTSNVDQLTSYSHDIKDVQEELNRSREPMIKLADTFKQLRQLVEDGRLQIANMEASGSDTKTHPDMEKMERDVTELLNKWQRLMDNTEQKRRNIEKSLDILMVYDGRERSPSKPSQSTSNSRHLSNREMLLSMQARGVALNKLTKSPPASSSDVKVLDPSNGTWISVKLAIMRGIYDAKREFYFNPKTGELLAAKDAAERNLVKLGDKSMIDDSMDSNNTDALLDGHMTGLHGFNINYSGEVDSDIDIADIDVHSSSPLPTYDISPTPPPLSPSPSPTPPPSPPPQLLEAEVSTVNVLTHQIDSIPSPVMKKTASQSVVSLPISFAVTSDICCKVNVLADMIQFNSMQMLRSVTVQDMHISMETYCMDNAMKYPQPEELLAPVISRSTETFNEVEDFPSTGFEWTAVSYDAAVRLSLIEIRSGLFRHPLLTGLRSLSLEQACYRGFIDRAQTALWDLKSGRCLSLNECLALRIIELKSGQVSPVALNDLQLAVSNCFLPRLSTANTIAQLNLIDAVKIGLLNPYTGLYTDPHTGDQMELDRAILSGSLSETSVYVTHPVSGDCYTLSQALSIKLLDPHTGDILSMSGDKVLVPFSKALLSGVYRSIYSQKTKTIAILDSIEDGRGNSISHIDINQAIRASKLPASFCLVFDTDLSRQVSYDEALAGGVIDRLSSSFVDKRSGTTISCNKALELGLIQPIACEICTHISLDSALCNLYNSQTELNNNVNMKEDGRQTKKYRRDVVQEDVILPTTAVSASSALQKDVTANVQAGLDAGSVTITEHSIEMESRKVNKPRANLSDDNISATEYFTKGDVEVELTADDDNPLDKYKVNRRDIKSLDWSSLPIKPLERQEIVVESSTKRAPTPPPKTNKEVIIIERDKYSVPVQEAITLGYIDCNLRTFTHPITGETVPINHAVDQQWIVGTLSQVEEAIKMAVTRTNLLEYTCSKTQTISGDSRCGLSLLEALTYDHLSLKSGTVRDPKSLIIYNLKDAIDQALIDGYSAIFTSPISPHAHTIGDAVGDGELDVHGNWVSPSGMNSGVKSLSFEEALAQGYIQLLSPREPIDITLTEIKTVSVHHVIHPVSVKKINYSTALQEGVIDTKSGVYMSPVTGDSLPLNEAISKRLITSTLISSKTRKSVSRRAPSPPPSATFTEKRSFTITHAKDTITGKNLTIREARSKGILDSNLTTYTDLKTNATYSIQEAIDNKLLTATLDNSATNTKSGDMYISTITHSVESVLNPKTRQHVSIEEAVKQGVIDEDTGDYVNMDSTEDKDVLSMQTAINKGLVKTRPVPTPVNETISFSISSVTDPHTGEVMTIPLAIKRGFLDKPSKFFYNPHNKLRYPLMDAIRNGWVQVRSNICSNSSNTITRSTNVTSTVTSRQWENNVPTSYGFTLRTQTQSHAERLYSTAPSSRGVGNQSFIIQLVRDVARHEDINVMEAIRRGVLDKTKHRYRNTYTNDVMSLDQAVRRNLIQLAPNPIYQVTYNQPTPAVASTIYQTPPTTASQIRRDQVQLIPNTLIKKEPTYAQVTKSPDMKATVRNPATAVINAPAHPSHMQPSHTQPPAPVPIYTQTHVPLPTHIQPVAPFPTPSSPESIDIHSANSRGLINHSTGEVSLPQYGLSMILDDAITQGILTTRIALSTLSPHPPANSMSVHEAFIRGCVNPVTLVVKHPAGGGRFFSLESALLSGLIHPKPSQSLSTVNPSPPITTASVYNTQAISLHRSQSMGKGPSKRIQIANKYDTVAGNLIRPANQTIARPPQSTTSTPHLVNGVFYTASHGYIINSNGQVINLSNGDVLTIDSALKVNAISRVGSDCTDSLTIGDVGPITSGDNANAPAVNLMYNRNKLEELYAELSHDLHTELEWGKAVEQALLAQHGLPSTDQDLRQQRDEHEHLLEDVHGHQQLARTVIYQNEQLRDQDAGLLSSEEVYEQGALQSELNSRLEKLTAEVTARSKLLSSCLDESVKFNLDAEKLERWLGDAESTLEEMRKRTNQLSRLKDVTDRYKEFEAEVIKHQADMRFLQLSVQRYSSEADAYRRRLIAFKATCLGARTSQLLDDEVYPVKERLDMISRRFDTVLKDCSSQVVSLNQVFDTQRQFNDACDKLESWLQMAEKNLGALKREPVRTDSAGLEEQLDRVREFTHTVLAQERLIDELRTEANTYSQALTQTRVDGRHIEDVHETVNDLACRHGLVLAESTARANILNTVIVQSQGIMASVDNLLLWTIDTSTHLLHMKPASLHMETIAEQLEEFKVFEADVENHKRAIDQVNSHASHVVSTCTPKMAELIETKLSELNSKSQALLSKCRERGHDLNLVYSDLREFNSRCDELTDWLSSQSRLLLSAANELSNNTLKDQVATIEAQMELKHGSVHSALHIGAQLVESDRTAQVSPVKERLSKLNQLWSQFKAGLEEAKQQVERNEVQYSYYQELLTYVTGWLSGMEDKIDQLLPVCLHMEQLESQIESMQPLVIEFKEHAGKIDALNDMGNRCDGAALRSPSTATSLSLPLSPSSAGAGDMRTGGPFTKFTSLADSQNNVFSPVDLSAIQRDLADSNHRYEHIGEQLSSRQAELEKTLSGLKSYLIDLQQLMVYLNEVEPVVLNAVYTPRDNVEAKHKLAEYKRFNDEILQRGSLLESIRQKVYALTANKDSSVPGLFDIESQLAQLEDRWKAVQQASLSRCTALESIESNLKNFNDNSQFLATWIAQKDKMLVALGPIATEPEMVKSQLHQVQVLEDELRSQQPKYDHCLESGIQILEKTPADSQQADHINSRLDSMAKNWNRIETQIKERRLNLRAVSDNSSDLYDSLSYISEWIGSANDKLQALESSSSMDSHTESNMISKLKADMDKYERMVKYAQDLSKKLIEAVKQPSAEAEIKQKMMTVSRPFNELKRKIDSLESKNDSRRSQEASINTICDDTLSWLQSVARQQQSPASRSAHEDRIKELIREQQTLNSELDERGELLKELDNKMDRLETSSGSVPSTVRSKVNAVKSEWKAVKRDADRHTQSLRDVNSKSDQLSTEHSKLKAWLDITKQKIDSLSSTPVDSRSQVEAALHEAQSLHGELARKQPEMSALISNYQEFLSSVDTDRNWIEKKMSSVERDWDTVEKASENTCRSLDSRHATLTEQHDLLDELTKKVSECEDMITARSSMGAYAFDSKNLDRVKNAQNQLRQLKPKLDQFRSTTVNSSVAAGSAGDGSVPSHIAREAEDLTSRFDALDASIDNWVSQIESATVQTNDFQASMKSANTRLSDMEDTLDGFDAISREAPVLRKQMDDVKVIESKLASDEDTVAQLETQCRKLTHAGYIHEPQIYKAQIESMKKQISRMQTKASQRRLALVSKQHELDQFSQLTSAVTSEISQVSQAIGSLSPIASDVQTIRKQQQQFKEYESNVTDPIQRRVEEVNKLAIGLIRNAQPGVSTSVLESTLSDINSRWSAVISQMDDREKRLDTSLLQAGKYQESVKSLLDWIQETQDMISNQKAPSADYKVAKAQLQEQKFVEKMVNDRKENVAAIEKIAEQIQDQSDSAERQIVNNQVSNLLQQWQGLEDKVDERSKALNDNLEATKTFHDSFEPFSVWLDKSERKLALAAPIASDLQNMQSQRDEQLQFNSEISEKGSDLGRVLKKGYDLIKSGHGDEESVSMLQNRLSGMEKRYSEMESGAKKRLEQIDSAIPVARNFQQSCDKLLVWLDKVEPALRSTNPEQHSSETQMLEKQLADIEPVFDVVVSEGASLTRLVPGEGAENITQVLSKTQKQFGHISSQIRKNADRQRAAHSMKVELESSIDELSEWFSDVESRLSTASPYSSDPDELRQKLATQQVLSDELIAQKGRLRQLANTAKKLQRDGIIQESPTLSGKLESTRIKADSLTQQSSDLLGRIEQVMPLASQFSQIHGEVVSWLEQIEDELSSNQARTPEQVKQKQQAANEVLHDITDHKPFLDRLGKVGPNLAKLCKGAEGRNVMAKLESVAARYEGLKSAVESESAMLKEKDEQTQKFTETVEDIITDLKTTQEAVVTAAPIAAKPADLKEQLDANQDIIDSMNRKLAELELVKADADRMIEAAGGIEDESVRAVKAKVANLTKMYNDVKNATEQRNSALHKTLGVSEDFWTGLDDVKDKLDVVHDTLDSEMKPALDPDSIRLQQEELEALQEKLHDMSARVNQVSETGDTLSALVGESQQPIVSTSVSGVNSDYMSLREAWKQRYDQLQAALEETNKFQADLVSILNWLQGKEDKMTDLGPIPGDTKSVRSQIEALKHFTNDINDKHTEVESLNQKASDMVKDRGDTETKVIKQPMSEVNRRWKSLLDAINQRKTKLQNALLSLGQFQAAVMELTQWLDRTETILAEEDEPTVYGDPRIIEIELAKHKILLNDVESHQHSIDQVNEAGKQVISSEGGADASTTRQNLDRLNERWEAILTKTKNWQISLEDALREALDYQSSLNDMVLRLSEIDGQLSASKPVGGLPETAKEQFQEFMEVYNELEQAQPRVAQLIQAGEDLIDKGNSVSAQALHQNLDNLKSRWDLVTNRATEKKTRLTTALQQAEQFHEEQHSFVKWLGVTEKTLDKLQPPGCTLDSMQTQISEHKQLSQEIANNREKMLQLDKTGTHLRYFSQKSDATLIKNTSISVQSRWEKIVSRIAERGRQLDTALRDAKTFNDTWTDLCQWLDNSDQLLDSSQISSNDPEKIKSQISKHKDFQRALGSKQPTYDTLMKQGKELVVKSTDESDTQTIGAMLTSLKSKWTSVCGKSIDRQRKLEESLLFSGQFKEALQALLGWLCKIEPFITDEQNVHGDLETVTKLADQQKVFQQELSKRASNMSQVRDTARELISKSEDKMPELQAQLIELTTSWEKVTKQAERRQVRIQEALRLAQLFSDQANSFLEWVSDCENLLRFDFENADDDKALQAALNEHKLFCNEISDRRQNLSDTLSLGEEILSRSHQEAVPIMRRWIAVLKQRMEDVDSWASNFEKSIQDSLNTMRNASDQTEELLSWLASSEKALLSMEEDPLPPDPSLIEEMLTEHQDFEAEITSRQADVDKLTKQKKRGERSGAATPTGRRSSTGTPSGRRSKADIRKTAQTPEPAFKNPRVQALSVKWRQVWLMTMDRRRRLQDALDQQRERQRLKNFNFDEWRNRYLDWMNHNKTRMMDFFRRIDKDRDGKVSRDEFINGILQSNAHWLRYLAKLYPDIEFPTSSAEVDAVANIFDKNGDGFIDYKEFMSALRTDIEKIQEKKTDAERIHEEVERQVTKCCCTKQYAIQKVSDNKYVFGESQKLRLVRILRSTVMVRVGGGWQALDEFLVKNDPCRVCSWSMTPTNVHRSPVITGRDGTGSSNLALIYFLAKGRTNTELREKFILSDNVMGQGMSGFVSRGATSGRKSSTGGARSGSNTPVTHRHYHHESHRHQMSTPTTESAGGGGGMSAGQRGTTPDLEVSAIMSRRAGGNSLSSSRASSRCSDISDEPDTSYPATSYEYKNGGGVTPRRTGSTSGSRPHSRTSAVAGKSRIPSLTSRNNTNY